MSKYERIQKRIERRTYLQGKFKGKFIGYLDPKKSDLKNENFYDLEVISGKITSTKDEINIRHWETGEPEEFQKLNNFLTKLPENLPLEIIDKTGNTKTYQINLNEIKLNNYELTNQVYDKHLVFGDIVGNISGYLKHYETIYEYKKIITSEDLEDVLEEDSILVSDETSSNTQKKSENLQTHRDNKRLKNNSINKTSYWATWEKESNDKDSNFSFWASLGLILRAILIFFLVTPFLFFGWQLFLPLIIIIGIIYLFTIFNDVIVSIFKWFFRLAGFGFIAFIIFSIVAPITNSTSSNTVDHVNNINDSDEVAEVKHDHQFKDSIISHHRIWNDYANNRYEANLKIRLSDFNKASRLRNSISLPLNTTSQYNRIVSIIHNYDLAKLDLVYKTLDSLQKENRINRADFPKVIVSLVQDIPYSLILQADCDPNIYNDNFINDYLNSKGDCQGNIRYGLLTPVEFMSTLKGDCDTRTLLLFTILNHYQYDVVMLSSELYKHSIIGINLPYRGISKSINGKNYIVWETTSKGIPPGIIPREIADMRFWKVSLMSNKNI